MEHFSKLFTKKCFWISPNKIIHCTKSSNYCDYSQFGSDRLHPHAGLDRGVFREDALFRIRIINKDWDNMGPLFEDLLEYKAIYEHFMKIREWKKSEFAQRNKIYIDLGNTVRGSKKSDDFLSKRQIEIDELIYSIIQKGILEEKSNFIDNISINIGVNGEIFFNNRGHHRLSIAKILGLVKIPVKITVARSERSISEFVKNSNF